MTMPKAKSQDLLYDALYQACDGYTITDVAYAAALVLTKAMMITRTARKKSTISGT